MSYWSNIQASRISWGQGWKNLWIPNYKKIYSKYFVSDVFTLQYINSKFTKDNKSNWTFTYYYDFALQKTFAKNFFIFKKYNVDLAWLIQAGYLGWFLALNEIFAKLVNTDFYATTIGAENFTNYFFWPQVYYYFYLLQELNNEYSIFNIFKPEAEAFHEDDYSVLQLLNSSFFVTKNILTTKSNFLAKDEFDGFEFFHYTFIRHNIAKVKDDKLEPNQVYKEKFKLANFLFNPIFLKKYPNFIFFYNSWLHKSWQLSKWKALESLKLFQSYYSPTKPVQNSINIFFSRMLKLFSAFKQLNMFIRNSKNAGVGITKEFIWEQINLLHLKLRIWDNMASQIKEVWFYLKAYLRYFSYEGKVNLSWSKIVFKKLFSFKKLLQTACTGISITTPALYCFLESFYFSIVKKKFFNSFLKIFFFFPNFLKNWYKQLVKFFIKILKLVRKIFSFRKINIFLKFFILYTISNSFLNKNYKNFRFTIHPKRHTSQVEQDFSTTLPYNINSLLFFYLLSTYPELKKFKNKKTFLILKIKSFFVPKLKLTTSSKNRKNFVLFYKTYFNMINILKHSNWFSILIFHPVIVLNFLKFTFTHKILWRRKFDYFYFILSNLTPKLFFWIFSDLENLLHFSMFIHLFTIYWQNFFFFYLFILKCLKTMYSQCSEDRLLYLTWPWIMFMQRSSSYNTILDLFSNAIVFYRNIGVYHLEKSYFEGSQKPAFTIADLGSCLMSFGKANCWVNTIEDKFQPLNKFTYDIDISSSPFYIPFFGIWSTSKAFFKKNSNFYFDKKNWINISYPFFITRTVTHIILDHYSNLEFSSALIAVFIKKRLEKEHKLTDILKNIGLLVSQAETIKGFMLIIKGRFTWKERASKLWIRKGKLHQVNLWTKLDFYKTAVTVKFGVVSIRVWMLLENILNDLHAIV